MKIPSLIARRTAKPAKTHEEFHINNVSKRIPLGYHPDTLSEIRERERVNTVSMVLFSIVSLAAIGLAFWAYRLNLQQHEQRVIARYEASQREQERQRKAALGIPHQYEVGAQAAAHPIEVEGVPVEVFEAECADVLAQISQRRREMRRPARRPTTRRVTAAE